MQLRGNRSCPALADLVAVKSDELSLIIRQASMSKLPAKDAYAPGWSRRTRFIVDSKEFA